ncbi:hypothetical protein QS713_05400 [Gleimia hominis]|uniref:Uncharacterized protein n=1 Tax=Gleimia hominis TaxID=595468 RepID=A0ABU3IDC4_9ACTO|nr:hypothetical protein [Gleimia hominis]MDT3767497.1 hypothetical protein [Gleimia hominis]
MSRVDPKLLANPPWVQTDATRPQLPLESGATILLAHVGPALMHENELNLLGYWHEVQHARWDGKTRQLTITWVDPSRPPLVATGASADPTVFMRSMEEYVSYSLVTIATRELDNGTAATVQVRRGPDGELFSVAVADGPLTPAGETEVEALETSLRDSVGLPRK